MGTSNTIERIKEEDAEIRVNSSGDTDSQKKSDNDSSIDGTDPNEKDKYGATRNLRHQISKKYQILEVPGKGS